MSCHPFYVSRCIPNIVECSFPCLDLVCVLACDIEVPENIAHLCIFHRHSQKWERVLSETILNIFVFWSIIPFTILAKKTVPSRKIILGIFVFNIYEYEKEYISNIDLTWHAINAWETLSPCALKPYYFKELLSDEHVVMP